jgi:hypothetical protein
MKTAREICQEKFKPVIELLQSTVMSPEKAEELVDELKKRIEQDVTLDKELLCVRCLKMVELNDAYAFQKGAIKAWPVHGECLDELNRRV